MRHTSRSEVGRVTHYMVNVYTLQINKKITNGNYTDLQRPRGFSGPMARVVSAALSLAGITHRDSGSASQIVSTKRVDYRPYLQHGLECPPYRPRVRGELVNSQTGP